MSITKTLLMLLLVLPGILKAQDDYDTTSYDDETYTEEATSSDYTYDEASFQPVEPSTLPVTKAYKDEKIEVQKFDKTEWKKIVGSTDYTEKKKEPEPAKESDNTSSMEPIDMPTPWAGEGLKIVFYVLVIGLVLVILWAVLRNMSFDLKLKRVGAIEDAVTNIENIEEIDIDSFLKKARAEKNYRLAIRLYYLGLLKRLNENGMISWKKDKTNLDYLTELFSRDFHYNDIRRLTLAYEEVWYGERDLTEGSFRDVTAEFEIMFGKMNSPVAS